jgi:cell division septation protein DedD
MREVFEEKDHDRDQPHLEPDLTLGPVTLLGLLLIWALVCALFFGWGYAMGHRGSEDASGVVKPAPNAPASSQAGCAQSKPSAVSQTEVATAAESDGADQVGNPSSTEASDAGASSISRSAAPAGAAGSSSSQPQVRPALPPAANPSQPATGSGGGLKVESALVPAGALMVQIAAVSHPEDSDVLVSALRKRGYAVTARREAADSLIHVRIGPFTSRDEANRWRQKLMNDGYNAIVQP